MQILKAEDIKYWKNFALANKKLLVFYGEDVLDLTKFCHQHPGGAKVIENHALRDVKNIFFSIYPHPSQAAQYLKRFACGRLRTGSENNKESYAMEQRKETNINNLSKPIQIKKEENLKIEKTNRAQNPKEQPIKNNFENIEKQNESYNLNKEILDEKKPEFSVPFFNSKFLIMKENFESV